MTRALQIARYNHHITYNNKQYDKKHLEANKWHMVPPVGTDAEEWARLTGDTTAHEMADDINIPITDVIAEAEHEVEEEQ